MSTYIETEKLEKDFFPAIIDKIFFGYTTQEAFIDIATPRRYKKAKISLRE